MSSFYYSSLLIFHLIFEPSLLERRIKGGSKSNIETYPGYMVYFVQADESTVDYQAKWTCGGAIVNKKFIITSAACVDNVQHMYAVAGCKTLELDHKNLKDENAGCPAKVKRKVIYTCVPKNYVFDYNATEKWARVDIAIVKVDVEYDFKNIGKGDYIVSAISFNTEDEMQKPGTSTIVHGWGHETSYGSKEDDAKNKNSENLLYAQVMIVDNKKCEEYYADNEDLRRIITKTMICTLGKGKIDEGGKYQQNKDRLVEGGCLPGSGSLLRGSGKCTEKEEEDFYEHSEVTDIDEYAVLIDGLRKRNSEGKNGVVNITGDRTDARKQGSTETRIDARIQGSTETRIDARKQGSTETFKDFEGANKTIQEWVDNGPGICQNDHGGPLVGWLGGRQYLIGVATLYRTVNTPKGKGFPLKNECIGPYLFTSTKCHGKFLDCVIEYDNKDISKMMRRRACEESEKLGYELIERRLSWFDHPDGPAENEKVRERPQVAISSFRGNRRRN